jgi:hypothetical protein
MASTFSLEIGRKFLEVSWDALWHTFGTLQFTVAMGDTLVTIWAHAMSSFSMTSVGELLTSFGICQMLNCCSECFSSFFIQFYA